MEEGVVGTGREGTGRDIYIYVYKMYVYINMVISWVKNRSPDMILTAFDVKFDEKKDEIPPRACNP